MPCSPLRGVAACCRGLGAGVAAARRCMHGCATSCTAILRCMAGCSSAAAAWLHGTVYYAAWAAPPPIRCMPPPACWIPAACRVACSPMHHAAPPVTAYAAGCCWPERARARRRLATTSVLVHVYMYGCGYGYMYVRSELAAAGMLSACWLSYHQLLPATSSRAAAY